MLKFSDTMPDVKTDRQLFTQQNYYCSSSSIKKQKAIFAVLYVFIELGGKGLLYYKTVLRAIIVDDLL